ncbi:hypothetical protein E4U23_001566 [Claviceps purpurea]|nr:hypothetical protein E4U23_001566 [Claviceps purpurea]
MLKIQAHLEIGIFLGISRVRDRERRILEVLVLTLGTLLLGTLLPLSHITGTTSINCQHVHCHFALSK